MFKRGGPAGFPESERRYSDQQFAQLEADSLSAPHGLTTTIAVPCGTLSFTKGLLTNKGTC